MNRRGAQIGGYRILTRLGAGGMGEAWLAVREESPNRRVVLKTILPHLVEDPSILERFLLEARVAALVLSPRVVAIEELGLDGDVYFIALEFVDGCSLQSLLVLPEWPASSAIAIWIAAECAAGLGDIHEAVDANGEALRIVHRDVSPGNILIDRSAQVKLSDFGVAKMGVASSASMTASVVGNLSYMAPEQFAGRPVDERTDIFALGLVLYRMLTGSLPYEAQSSSAFISQISAGRIIPIRQRAPALPEALIEIVDRALQEDPSRRFGRARDLLEALENSLSIFPRDNLRGELCSLVAKAALSVPTTTALESEGTRPAARELTAGTRTVQISISARRWPLLGVAAAVSVLILLRLVGLFSAGARRVAPDVQVNDVAPARAQLTAAAAFPPAVPPWTTSLETERPVKDNPSVPRSSPALASPHEASERKVRLVTVPSCEVWRSSKLLGSSPVTLIDRGMPLSLTLISRVRGIDYDFAGTLPRQSAEMTLIVPKGKLTLSAWPWADVFLDGKALGQTPLPPIEVYAGRHRAVLVNRTLGARRELILFVPAGREKRVQIKLP